MFNYMIFPWFATLAMAVVFYQVIRFHKEGERIQSIVHRIVDISQKNGLKNYSIRKLKYSRMISNSYTVMRDIDKSLTALERELSHPTPYRLRRLIFVSNSEVLDNIENRLDKIEALSKHSTV